METTIQLDYYPSPSEEAIAMLYDIFQEGAGMRDGRQYWYDVKLSALHTYKLLKKEPDTVKQQLVFFIINKLHDTVMNNIEYDYHNRAATSEITRYKSRALDDIMTQLMKSNLDFPDDALVALLKFYHEAFTVWKQANAVNWRWFLEGWPILQTIQQIEKQYKDKEIPESLKNALSDLVTWEYLGEMIPYRSATQDKLIARANDLIQRTMNGGVIPFVLQDDRLGTVINVWAGLLKGEEQAIWYRIFQQFDKAIASKPSGKWLKEMNALADEAGLTAYKKNVWKWLEFVGTLDEEELDGDYGYILRLLDSRNAKFMKGLVWSLVRFHDSKTLSLVALLAERSHRKVPNFGAMLTGVGNACFYVLANTKGLEGISQLSRMKLKIKQSSTRKLAEKYLDEASLKLGISSSQIEELSIPDFGLELGQKAYAFEDYQLLIEIEDVGKVKQVWQKADGTLQKSVPSFVKSTTKHQQRLKKAKSEVTQLKKYLTAQRDRIDRIYLDDRTWSYEEFEKYYFNHGLVSFIARKLIWQFEVEGTVQSAIFHEGKWVVNLAGTPLSLPLENATVRLWHPCHVTSAEVMQWRETLYELQIKQPIKQAYREVYLLTDAEINTGTYSNRMAAHLLKQNQFSALAKVRGWQYTLMGPFDHGFDVQRTNIPIKAHKMEAQFWVSELMTGDHLSYSGMWSYITTDQVRFIKENEVMNLADVPAVVFSEIMRDVDLFVGVCSVGNDPEWRDNGGLPQYRNYWESYSFGDLTEVAKTRKELLEKLVPRLKIKNVASIEGKFLKVKGTKRTYKIHIGSTNILMEPNDQYLCIVPDGSLTNKSKNVFLPFEGDKGLSIILSKALLLAADHKITDSTILSQIDN